MKLIQALRAVATHLENGTLIYKWSEPHNCNCGILAAAILEKSANDIKKLVEKRATENDKEDGHLSNWKSMAATHCPITGIPNDELFKGLIEAGMKIEDFRDLEYLKNPEVCKRAGLTTNSNQSHKPNVIKYMRAWADILEEELARIETERADSLKSLMDKWQVEIDAEERATIKSEVSKINKEIGLPQLEKKSYV